MKRFLMTAVMLVVLTAVALPMFALGKIAGPSPITNSLNVSVILATRVGINLSGSDVTFDLTGPNYPPASLPGYYLPSTPALTPFVPLSVFCNTSSGWLLEVKASDNFHTTLPITQLFYAPDGEAITADGNAAPGGNWVAFSLSDVTVASAVAMTNGWPSYDQDYMLQITGNEDAAMGTATVIITYTISTL